MNQYPPAFYEPLIRDSLTRIVAPEQPRDKEEKPDKPFLIFLQYRGKCSESYARDIRLVCTDSVVNNVSCKVIFTLKKIRTVLSSLKEMNLRSKLVYKITCSHCNVCYDGKTSRHLQIRFKEPLKKCPFKAHLEKCVGGFTLENDDILGSTSRGQMDLLTLEAMWIRELKPYLNTEDTMRSRDSKSTIKI